MTDVDVKTYSDDAAIGKTCPSLELLDFIKGTKVDLQPGRVHVLFFFVSFYKGAYAVHEEITALSEKYTDVTFIAISNDADRPSTEKYLGKAIVDENTKLPQRMDTAYIAFDDKKTTAKCFAALSNLTILHVPQGIIVDKSGKVAWKQMFTQSDTVAQSNFEVNLRHVIAGEPIENANGPKPRVVDEGEAADVDDMSLF